MLTAIFIVLVLMLIVMVAKFFPDFARGVFILLLIVGGYLIYKANAG